MVQLARQRRSRPPAGPVEHHRLYEVTSRRLGQNLTPHSPDLRGPLARAGKVRAIQDSQLCGDSRLLRLQQRRLADSSEQSGQPCRKVIRDKPPPSVSPCGMPLVQ